MPTYILALQVHGPGFTTPKENPLNLKILYSCLIFDIQLVNFSGHHGWRNRVWWCGRLQAQLQWTMSYNLHYRFWATAGDFSSWSTVVTKCFGYLLKLGAIILIQKWCKFKIMFDFFTNCKISKALLEILRKCNHKPL